MTSDTPAAEGRPIWFLNRGVLIVRPKQPFVDWVCSFEDGEPVSPDDAWDSVNSFLVPEFDEPDQTLEWIQGNADTVFEIMLNDWSTEPETWPTDRGWSAFEDWFELEYVDLAWDLVDEPLSSEAPNEG